MSPERVGPCARRLKPRYASSWRRRTVGCAGFSSCSRQPTARARRTLREELVFLGLKQFRLDLMLRREELCTDDLKECLRISRTLEAGSFGALDLTNDGLDESH